MIDNILFPLLKEKCVLLDLPYYPNPGDCMIWMGMEEFVKKHGVECVYRASAETFDYRPLATNVVICLVGGGNFGDLWNDDDKQLVCKISKLYPQNRIIVFPQSVYYCSEKRMLQDSLILSHHQDLHICARDKKSYEFFRLNFSTNNILLAPDMAFYLKLNRIPNRKGSRKLFLKRNDKEAINYNFLVIEDMDVADWPMMKIETFNTLKRSLKEVIHRRFLRFLAKNAGNSSIILLYKLLSIRFLRSIKDKSRTHEYRFRYILQELWYMKYLLKMDFKNVRPLLDWFAYVYFLPTTIEYAINYISQYDEIITTRLHGGVLAILLERNVEFIDNSYGKISAFYNTWLQMLPNVKLYK